MNGVIINSNTRLHLVGYFYWARLGVFFNSSLWCMVTRLPIFLFVLWTPLDTIYHCGSSILFCLLCYFCLNKIGPFCIHVSSICPTAKGRKTDWKYWQCSEVTWKNDSKETIQMTCNNYKKQFLYHNVTFTFVLNNYFLVFKTLRPFFLYSVMRN